MCLVAEFHIHGAQVFVGKHHVVAVIVFLKHFDGLTVVVESFASAVGGGIDVAQCQHAPHDLHRVVGCGVDCQGLVEIV